MITEPAYIARLRQPRSSGPETLPPPPADYVPPRAELAEVPRPIRTDLLDPDAVRIVKRLTENGFLAYLVGGSVRDLLFGLKPKDFDIVTSATPKDMRKLFRNCRIIGRRFRLAHVFFRDKIIEVATFRAATPPPEVTDREVDDDSTGHEHGALIIRDDNVFGTPEEDALRRDFTVNALMYDVERQVILDYVGGVADVERKEIRTIGDPRIRMREDPIRMLRAIRLAARMGCRIEPATWDAIVSYRQEIVHAAAPRIGEDVLRMFRGGAVLPALDMMIASGVLEVILPELHQHLALSLDAGTEEVEGLRAALRIADAKTQAGQPLTTPVQLSLLLAPTLLTPANGRRVTPESAGEALRPMAQRLAISKKDSERIRQVLFTVPRLAPVPGGRKRRPSGPLVRRAFFPEALDLFEVMALASGDCLDEAARWRKKLAEAFPQGPPAHEPKPRARSRSRGPRRGGGGGNGGGGNGGGDNAGGGRGGGRSGSRRGGRSRNSNAPEPGTT